MALLEITKNFGTQDACLQHLEKHRWGDRPKCPYCGSIKTAKRNTSFRHICLGCNRSFSVLVGTILESTKLPLPKWFLAIFLIVNAKKGLSSLQLSRDLGVNKNTAWYLQKRIRKSMSEDDGFLSGLVEVDETYVGGSLSNKHFHKKQKQAYYKTGMEHKSPVLGMLERNGKIIVKLLEKAHGQEIKPILEKHISHKSKVITDGFGGYYGISHIFKKHIKLNHTRYVRKMGRYHTNTVEGFWTMLKRSIIGQYHKVTPGHLQGYLDELAFKYNYRNQDMFNLLITRMMNAKTASI